MDTSRIAYPYSHGLIYEEDEDNIDISELEAFYNEVKDTDMSQYIKFGESGFKKALNNARKVLNNPDSQEEVENALETLKEAYRKLQLNKKEK